MTKTSRGSEHPDTAAVLLAWTGRLVGVQDTAALVKLERLLDIHERIPNPDDKRLLEILRTLDGLLCEQGDYETVRAVYVRFLAAFEQLFGPEHPQTVAVRTWLTTLPA